MPFPFRMSGEKDADAVRMLGGGGTFTSKYIVKVQGLQKTDYRSTTVLKGRNFGPKVGKPQKGRKNWET